MAFASIPTLLSEGARKAISLTIGCSAMVLVMALALHADVKHGILHDFLSSAETAQLNPQVALVGSRPPPSSSPMGSPWEPPPAEPVRDDEAFFESLASDVVLQDIPLRDLER